MEKRMFIPQPLVALYYCSTESRCNDLPEGESSCSLPLPWKRRNPARRVWRRGYLVIPRCDARTGEWVLWQYKLSIYTGVFEVFSGMFKSLTPQLRKR